MVWHDTKVCLQQVVIVPTGKLRSEWMVMPFILNEAFPVVAVTVKLC